MLFGARIERERYGDASCMEMDGLVIRPGEANWPIRLFMNADAGFKR